MSGIFLPQRSLQQKPPVGNRFNSNCSLMRGLQCLYLFNEGGGGSFAEASGQHPAATLVGGSGTCWASGFSGSTLQVSSSIGYVNAGNICDNLANFSVSLWFRTTATPTNACIVGKLGSGGTASGQGWAVHHLGGNVGIFTQLSGGSTYKEIDTSASYNNNKWHHGVFTVSGYIPQKIYIDGVPVATSSQGSGTVTTTTTSSNLQFGSDNGTGDPWLGSLDVVGIWNRVLTSDEVERLYIDPFYFMSSGGRTFLSKARIIKRSTAPESFAPAGIFSQEMFGAEGIALALAPLGIASQEMLGAAKPATNNASNLFFSSIPSAENNGATLFNEAISFGGIASAEAEGTPQSTLTLHSLGITSGELFGALKSAISNRAPTTIPLYRRSKFSKPPAGAKLDANHPLTQGLAAAWVMNEGGGFAAIEQVSSISNGFSGYPTSPNWINGQFGPAVHFPGGSNAARIVAPDRPAYTDLGLNGPMSVAFWYNFDAAQLALASGSTMLGKSDSTDGVSGFTHGWNVNSDNWHLITGGTESSGPQNIKLEFERSLYNKQGGIPAPTTPGVWHHIVITTAGGASTPSVNDYVIYLDGVLQQSIFFVAGTGDPTTSDAGYNLAIGSHPSGSVPFAGSLDTVLLYNRVLSSAEAQQLYTDPFCFIKKRKQLIRATHTTGSLSITPLGIASAQQVGAMQMQTAKIIAPLGIASGEKLGALQSAIANIQAMYPGAIVSLESLGADTVIVAVPIGTPASRILNPTLQYRIFNLKIEDRIL